MKVVYDWVLLNGRFKFSIFKWALNCDFCLAEEGGGLLLLVSKGFGCKSGAEGLAVIGDYLDFDWVVNY